MNRTQMKLMVTTFLGISLLILTSCSPKPKAVKTNLPADTAINPVAELKSPDTVRSSAMITKSDPSWHEALKTEQQISQNQKQAASGTETEISLSKAGAQGKPGLIKTFNDPIRSQELLDGLEKAKNGDLKGAVADFDKALTLNQRNYVALFFRAKAKLEMGNADGALEDIQSSLKIYPNQAAGHFLAGRIYFTMKKYNQALTEFNSSLEIVPGDAKVLNFRGVIKASQGNHTQAIIDYDSSLLSDPNAALTYYNKGTSFAALQKYPEAIACFTDALKREQDMKLSYMNRGNCYVLLNDQQAALADYTKLIELDPNNADAYFNRGAAYAMTNDSRMCDDWKKAAALGSTKAAESLKKNCKK